MHTINVEPYGPVRKVTPITLAGSQDVPSTARYILTVDASGAGYTLTVPAKKSYLIQNIGVTNSFTVAYQSSSVVVPVGSEVRVTWDDATLPHHHDVHVDQAVSGLTVDSSMDGSSANAVENQVVKSYIDTGKYLTITATAHGLVSGDLGKPIDTEGVILDDVLATEFLGVLVSIPDANTLELAPGGSVITIANALLENSGTWDLADTAEGRYADWDKSQTLYVDGRPYDSHPQQLHKLVIESIGGSTFRARVREGL